MNNEDLRRQSITVYNLSNDVLLKYEGGAYIYYNDQEKNGFFHFKDEKGAHHRVYGDVIVVINEL